MKAKQRHELHTNELADWIGETSETLKPYSGLIVAGLVAVVVVVAVIVYFRGASQRAAIAASDQLITALGMQSEGAAELQATVKDYPGTPQANLAEMILGQNLLDIGTSTLFHNKLAGRENISKSLNAFLEVQKNTHDPMLKAWALFGEGRAQESLGDLARAQVAYQQIVNDYPDSDVAEPARQHLKRLESPAIRSFYDWFAAQDIRPPAADTSPGVPGLRPSFDIKEPVSPGDVKLPSALEPSASGPAASGPALSEPSSRSTGATSSTPPAPPSPSTQGNKSGEKAPPEPAK